MWLCMMMLEMFCGFGPQFPDQIFADGAENMWISTDRPSISSWVLSSTPSNDAALVTSTDYLTDGKVATPTRITWDSGAQTTSTYIALRTSAISFDISNSDLQVVALLFPKTPYAVPEGVTVQVFIDFGAGLIIQYAGPVVTFDDGSTGIVAVLDLGFSPVIKFSARILNNQNGSTWAAPGQTIDVGEFWYGTLQEFKNTTDPKRKLVDLVTNRRSHNNTNQPLFGGNPFYQWTYTFTPMSEASAYSSATIPTYAQIEYALSQTKASLIIGRIYTRGTTTVDQASVNYSSAFGRPATDGLRELQAHKDGHYWLAGLTFETQPG